jgi:hypothetical protein
MATRIKVRTWIIGGVCVYFLGLWALSHYHDRQLEAEEAARLAAITPQQREAMRQRAIKEREANRQRIEQKRLAAAEKAEADALVNRAAVGARVLKKSALDPERFKLESALVIDGTGAVCYTYRAANMYGGIMPGQAVLSAKGEAFMTDAEPGFVKMWNAECGGRTGSEVATAIRWFAL